MPPSGRADDSTFRYGHGDLMSTDDEHVIVMLAIARVGDSGIRDERG
jgi:hypothetical protein